MKKAVSMTRWNEKRLVDSILHEAYHSGAKWNESFYKSSSFDKNFTDARGELDLKKKSSLSKCSKTFMGRSWN